MGGSDKGWSLKRDARSGTYTVRWRDAAGRRHHRSTRTRDRAEAQVRAAEIVDALRHGRATAARTLRGVDLVRLMSEWLAAMELERRPSTLRTWRDTYVPTHFVPFFRDAAELTSAPRLAAYVSHRLRSARAETVAKECSAIQSLLRWCARPDVGYLESAPVVPRPPRGSGRAALHKVRVDLTAEQVETLLDALPETIRAKRRGEEPRPCRAFFRVLWETGLRAGSLWALEAPGDYRRGASELVLRAETDKAAFGRTLPLTDGARAALDSVCPDRGPVFGEERIDYRTQLERAALAAGIPEDLAPHVSPHDFRHARTTALVDSGAPLTGVAYLVGHRQITTTKGFV